MSTGSIWSDSSPCLFFHLENAQKNKYKLKKIFLFRVDFTISCYFFCCLSNAIYLFVRVLGFFNGFFGSKIDFQVKIYRKFFQASWWPESRENHMTCYLCFLSKHIGTNYIYVQFFSWKKKCSQRSSNQIVSKH